MPRIVIAVHVHQDIPPDWLKELANRYNRAITDCDVRDIGQYHVDHVESGIIEGETMTHAHLAGFPARATEGRIGSADNPIRVPGGWLT